MTRRYRQPTDESILAALRSGASMAAVVRDVGGGQSRIRALRDEAGIPPMPEGKPPSPVDEAALLSDLQSGAPWVATARRYRIGYKRVQELALASGLPQKPKGPPPRPRVAPELARAHLLFTCAPPPKALAGRPRW